MENLLMLCLPCHKIIDELERKYSVETLREWKVNHFESIASLFKIPVFPSERALLIEVDQLLDQNAEIFKLYGPYSTLALNGIGGDTQRAWRMRCLDTILPNNERIIQIIAKHKNSFGYPWDVYKGMLTFEVHANSFRENCLFEKKINDYRTFPQSFPNLIKSKLSIPVKGNEEQRREEEIEYRYNTVTKYINEFLSRHNSIRSMQEISRGVLVVEQKNGRRLRVFVTNTYFFTKYTYEKILIEDPNIDVIICSNPYSSYTYTARQKCIEDGIGLFKLSEFMGALNFDGEKFLNYISQSEVQERIEQLQLRFRKNLPTDREYEIYLFGSYLRKMIYKDIDVLIVYKDGLKTTEIDFIVKQIKKSLADISEQLHFQHCSERELPEIKMSFDNRVKLI